MFSIAGRIFNALKQGISAPIAANAVPCRLPSTSTLKSISPVSPWNIGGGGGGGSRSLVTLLSPSFSFSVGRGLGLGLLSASEVAPVNLSPQLRTKTRNHFPRPREHMRIRKHGWKKRLSTPGGRAIIMRRIMKGRYILSH